MMNKMILLILGMFSFAITAPGLVKVTVWDLRGRAVRECVNYSSSAAPFYISLDGIAAGNYLLSYRQSASVLFRKFITVAPY